ncbi:MAG: flagellar hook-length control protein FliK [Oscillospiraceae bacterium]|nr:flagellar hook-length control protein FliK [Oscillospiraceae bacterium]
MTTDALLIANAEPQSRIQSSVQPPRNVRYENVKREGSFSDALGKSASTAKTEAVKAPRSEASSAKTENDLAEKLDSATTKKDYTTENNAPKVTKDSGKTDIPSTDKLTGKDEPLTEVTDELTTVIVAPLLLNMLATPTQLPEDIETSDLRVMMPDGTLELASDHPEIGQLSLLEPEKYAGLNPEIETDGKFQSLLQTVDNAVENVRTVQTEQVENFISPEITTEPDTPQLTVSDNTLNAPLANPDLIAAQTTMVANTATDSAKLTDEGAVKPGRDIFMSDDKGKPLVSVESAGEDTLEPITAIEEAAPVTPRESAGGNAENTSGGKTKDNETAAIKEPQNGQTIDLAPRQVFAQAQTEAAKPVSEIQDVRPNEIFNRLVESAQLIKDVDGSSITMQLKPEHLGKVALQVALNGEGTLNLKITAEDPNVRGMLNTQLAKLVETLSEKGLKIASADVVYTGVADNNYGEANRQRQDGENAPGRRDGRRYIRESAVATLDPNAALLGYQPYFGDDAEAMEYVA